MIISEILLENCNLYDPKTLSENCITFALYVMCVLIVKKNARNACRIFYGVFFQFPFFTNSSSDIFKNLDGDYFRNSLRLFPKLLNEFLQKLLQKLALYNLARFLSETPPAVSSEILPEIPQGFLRDISTGITLEINSISSSV